MKKIANGRRFDLLRKVEKYVLQAGMFVVLTRTLYHNRLLEKKLAPLRHDSHVALRALVVRNETVMKNYGLAVRIALRHHNNDIAPLKDFIGYGVEGLIKAAEGFRPEEGSKFSSYAGACIVNTIKRSVIENEFSIRLPEHYIIKKERRRREEIRAYVEKGIEPSLSSKKGEKVMPEIAFSVDDHKKGDDGDNLESLFVSEDILSPEDFALRRSIEERRAEAIALLQKELTEVEWKILRGRFCFDTDEPVPFRTIGATLGLSHDHIHKKTEKSLGKARRVLSRNKLTSESFF